MGDEYPSILYNLLLTAFKVLFIFIFIYISLTNLNEFSNKFYNIDEMSIKW